MLKYNPEPLLLGCVVSNGDQLELTNDDNTNDLNIAISYTEATCSMQVMISPESEQLLFDHLSARNQVRINAKQTAYSQFKPGA